MQALNKCLSASGAPLGVLVLLAAGCGGVDDSQSSGATDPGSSEAQTESLRAPPWYRHRPPHSTGGTTATGGAGGTTATAGAGGTMAAAGTGGVPASGGSVGTSDCSICTTTQACCLAVNAGALCTFSADTCASLDPGRQATYSNDCLVVTRTIISAWAASNATPPPVCTLP